MTEVAHNIYCSESRVIHENRENNKIKWVKQTIKEKNKIIYIKFHNFITQFQRLHHTLSPLNMENLIQKSIRVTYSIYCSELE